MLCNMKNVINRIIVLKYQYIEYMIILLTVLESGLSKFEFVEFVQGQSFLPQVSDKYISVRLDCTADVFNTVNDIMEPVMPAGRVGGYK